MGCQNCGAYVAHDAEFCPKCGAHVEGAPPSTSAYPPPMFVSRVQRHVQALGIWWCVYAAYRLLHALAVVFFLRAVTGGGSGDWHWMHWSGPMGGQWFQALIPFATAVSVGWAVLSVVVGYGLVKRKFWARVLAIVAGILALINIPLGTALGLYTLWVLASGPAGMEYEAIADRS